MANKQDLTVETSPPAPLQRRGEADAEYRVPAPPLLWRGAGGEALRLLYPLYVIYFTSLSKPETNFLQQ
jgi:hypothetical protein